MDTKGVRRNLVYARRLQVFERKGRMGKPKHSSEKGEWDDSPSPSYCALGIPSSSFSQKPKALVHKPSFYEHLLDFLSFLNTLEQLVSLSLSLDLPYGGYGVESMTGDVMMKVTQDLKRICKHRKTVCHTLLPPLSHFLIFQAIC